MEMDDDGNHPAEIRNETVVRGTAKRLVEPRVEFRKGQGLVVRARDDAPVCFGEPVHFLPLMRARFGKEFPQGQPFENLTHGEHLVGEGAGKSFQQPASVRPLLNQAKGSESTEAFPNRPTEHQNQAQQRRSISK